MTSCERTILECSLAELIARRKLKESSNEKDSENVEIIEEVVEVARRPYLSKTERNLAESLPESALKEYFKPGEFVHFPMTREEKVLIDQIRKFNKRKHGYDVMDEEDLKLVSEMLPGRKFEDVNCYMEDLLSGQSDNDSILVYTGGLLVQSPAPPTSVNHGILSSSRSYEWATTIQKQFSIFESSGSIEQIAIRTGKKNARVMIGACAKMDDERYNRIGELIMAYREPTVTDHNNFDVLILDGHKKLRNTATGPAMLRQSVPCVAYDPLTDIFASGGYDGDVVAWKASTAVALETIGSHPKPINTMAFHSSTPLLAYGCQNGGLYYFNAFSELGERGSRARPVTVFTLPKARDGNTVDVVAIPSTGPKSNSVYAGIGYLQSSASGIIEGWDLATGTLNGISEKLYDGFSCMNISPCGNILATGTGGLSSEHAKGDGILRIMDLGQDLKTVMSIDTKKYDMDSVSFSPRSNLLFLGENSDSSVSIYDLRFPSEPIFFNAHGAIGADAIVAHAWIANGNILATGGHDGHVKLWDCQRGFSLLNKFEFNSSITCITYSEADHCIWVGTDNGGVYMLSSPGFLGDTHPSVLSGKCVF